MAKGVDWARVRAEYAAGAPVNALARRHNVSPQLVRRRKAAEGWTRVCETDAPAAAPSSDADGTDAKQDAKQGAKLAILHGGRRDERPGSATYGYVDVSDEALSGALRAAAKRMLDRLNAGQILPGMHQSEADVFASVVTGAKKAIDASREVAGKRPGQPSCEEAPDPDAGRLVIETQVLEPVKIPVDEKGRLSA